MEPTTEQLRDGVKIANEGMKTIITAALDKYDKFEANLRWQHEKGWRRTLFLFCSDYSWARRILGGKWELWVYDQGAVGACLSWHWLYDWTDKILDDTKHVVAKRWYVNGMSLTSIVAYLREYDDDQHDGGVR